MQAGFYFRVENHYNEENTGIVLTRTLKEIPYNNSTFDRLWTLHILHKHEAPGVSDQSMMYGSPFCGREAPKSSAEKIQNCVSTLFGIGSIGITETEVYQQFLQLHPFSESYCMADPNISQRVHRNFPIERWEEAKVCQAVEGALKMTIEMEKLTFNHAI